MDADFKTVEGDEEPFTYPIIDPDTGDPKDLTGLDVTFRMRIEDESAVAITAAATIATPEVAGIVSAPVVGPPGTYHAEFVVDDGGDEETFPRDRTLRVVIRPRV